MSNIYHIATLAAETYAVTFAEDFEASRDAMLEALDKLDTLMIDCEVDGEEITAGEALERLYESQEISAGEFDALEPHMEALS